MTLDWTPTGPSNMELAFAAVAAEPGSTARDVAADSGLPLVPARSALQNLVLYDYIERTYHVDQDGKMTAVYRAVRPYPPSTSDSAHALASVTPIPPTTPSPT